MDIQTFVRSSKNRQVSYVADRVVLDQPLLYLRPESESTDSETK